MDEFEGIEWPDYLVIALYFIFVLAVGLFVSAFHHKRSSMYRPIVIPLNAPWATWQLSG